MKAKSGIFSLRESDKHFLLALLAVTGVVFFWRGAWLIMDNIPILENPFVSLAIGLAVMTFSGVIYREFIPEEEPLTPLVDVIKEAFKHTPEKRKGYVIKYYDAISKKHKEISHFNILRIEHNFLITEQDGEEFFIPLHRIHRIHSKGKVLWQAKEEKGTPIEKPATIRKLLFRA